jgi:DeoR family transcriptional regulator, fructose operon transcriptional repressor
MDNKTTGPVLRNTRERREAIIGLLQQNRQVSVIELSQSFQVSEVSIRRDLDYLEKIGLAQRMHGGARLSPSIQQSTIFDSRLLEDVHNKALIGQEAALRIRLGDTILLDSGTTVLEVARNIPQALLDSGNLTIVTRSLSIAAELRKHRHLRLIVLGGMYLPEYDDFVGSQVEYALQGLHVNTLFIGTEGIHPERGLTTDNIIEMGLYPRLALIADRVIVVATAKKFVGKLQILLPLDSIHTLITDCNAPEPSVKALRERGLEVIVVGCL